MLTMRTLQLLVLQLFGVVLYLLMESLHWYCADCKLQHLGLIDWPTFMLQVDQVGKLKGLTSTGKMFLGFFN